MKRDTIDLRIDEIRELATKYSKKDLQRMVQMGIVEPQKAVMAGMMIDRIAKSAIEPPTTTVAEDVLGTAAPTAAQAGMPAPGIMGAPQAPAPSDGVAALPSGLQNMAGGGIVAFADGGETDDIPGYADRGLVDAGVIDKIDPNWRSTRNRKKYTADDKFAILAEQLRDLQSELGSATGEDKRRLEGNIAQVQREMRGLRAAPSQAADIGGLGALISSAQAAEKAPMTRAPVKAAAAPDYMYQDPFGAPDYTTEGFSLKQQVTPGKPYEPTLQGAIFGYEEAPQQSLPPIAPPSKKPAAPTTFEPTVEAPARGAEEVPAEESRMGPARPTSMDRLMGGLRGAQMEVPAEKGIQQAFKEQEEAETLAGVDRDIFNKLRQDYKEVGGKLKDRADKAAGFALMMFGAGLAGARQGQEWETASRAGQQALMSYMGAMDRINENEDRLNQAMRDLSLSENQYKRSRSDKALAEVNSNKREIRAIQLENAKLEQQGLLKGAEFTVDMIKNQNPAMWQTLQNIAQEQQRKGNKGYTALDALRDYQGVTKSGEVSEAKARQEWASNPMIQSKYPDPNDYVRFVTGGGGGGASGTFNYVPGKGLQPAQ